jgi:putative component of membrane protein insertase Oxa1/YidC/SpoIIIJ protein YidD
LKFLIGCAEYYTMKIKESSKTMVLWGGIIFPFRAYLARSEDILRCHRWLAGGVGLLPPGKRPGMLLSTPYCARQPPQQRLI